MRFFRNIAWKPVCVMACVVIGLVAVVLSFFWIVGSAASDVYHTDDPIARGLKWIALAILAHAFIHSRDVKRETEIVLHAKLHKDDEAYDTWHV